MGGKWKELLEDGSIRNCNIDLIFKRCPDDIADVSSFIDFPTRRFCMHNEPQRQWLHADLAGCAAIFAMIEYGETDETNYSR